jgi:integrase
VVESATVAKTRTFVDADVLINAFRGIGPTASAAQAVVDDPDREFVVSDILRLELLPKHRQRDVVPLRPDLVPLVREWISQLHNGDPLFYLLEQRKMAKMIQADLEVAGIPYQDANGLYADFHALRYSFITGGLGIRGKPGGGNGSGAASSPFAPRK